MPRLRRTTITRAAQDDLSELRKVDVGIVKAAYRIILDVDAGRVTPRPLTYRTKTGDLSDCSKVYFGADDGYRVVFREVDGLLEVREVVVVEERTADLPYLLAGLRLDRIEDAVHRSDARRAVHRVRKRRRHREPD